MSNPQIYTRSSKETEALNMATLQKIIEEYKSLPAIVKEIRLRRRRFVFDIMKEETITLVSELFGIKVVTDPTLAYNKMKFIYTDGREKLYTIERKDELRSKKIHSRKQPDRRN